MKFFFLSTSDICVLETPEHGGGGGGSPSANVCQKTCQHQYTHTHCMRTSNFGVQNNVTSLWWTSDGKNYDVNKLFVQISPMVTSHLHSTSVSHGGNPSRAQVYRFFSTISGISNKHSTGNYRLQNKGGMLLMSITDKSCTKSHMEAFKLAFSS
ncbi:hypothetical protein DMENIID0001_084190 [Sergentomyia squamirostris]